MPPLMFRPDSRPHMPASLGKPATSGGGLAGSRDPRPELQHWFPRREDAYALILNSWGSAAVEDRAHVLVSQ
jgi:hypothetical protein